MLDAIDPSADDDDDRYKGALDQTEKDDADEYDDEGDDDDNDDYDDYDDHDDDNYKGSCKSKIFS